MRRYIVPYFIYSAVALLCIFLQSGIFSYLQIFHAKPDLLLLFVVLGGLKSDWKNGFAGGIVLGFWIDLLNGGYFGTNMVVYSLIGMICGVLGKRFPDRTYEGYFFTAVAASLCAGFLHLTVFQIIGATFPLWQTIIGTILPMAFYTSLISFLCLPLVFLYRRRKGSKIGRIDLLGNGVIFVRGNEKVDMAKVARYRAAAAKEKRGRREQGRRRAYEQKKRQSAAGDKIRRGAADPVRRGTEKTMRSSGSISPQSRNSGGSRKQPKKQNSPRRKP
ncbi:MAG TPA: rod shape-determining protein MreD [Clostridiales bacterium]|nr:rod shape-determining protein MreD [Clostridiales bacterium]